MPDFIPRKDGDCLLWGREFTSAIGASPGTYNVPVELATAMGEAFEIFAAEYARALAPTTRGPSAVFAKDTARAAFVERARRVAQIARASDASAQELLDVGLRPRAERRRQVAPPGVGPHVLAGSTGAGSIDVLVSDAESPMRIGKPPGAASAMVYVCYGEEYAANSAAWQFVGATTRARTTFTLPNPPAPGTRVWVTARWASARADTSPPGNPVHTHFAFGMRSIAA